jgi:hypothetical protein
MEYLNSIRRLPTLCVALALGMLLTGCFRVAAIGSSKDDALRTMGQPSAKRTTAQGEEVWEYSGASSWRQAYLVRFGADGRLLSTRQVLTEDNIRSLVPAAAMRTDVRNALGKPGYVVTYPTGEVWEYRIYDDHRRPAKMTVQFGADGTVKEVGKALEDRADDLFTIR